MKVVTLFSLLLISFAGGGEGWRLNEVQVLGTHNSYRTRPPEPLWGWLQKLPVTGAGDPRDLDYGHGPLPEQLGRGVRSVELDLYADPEGGRYLGRAGLKLAGGKEGSLSDEARAELAAPGIKVLHLPDFDFGSQHLTFAGALVAVKQWSESHPRHVPLIIHLETKNETMKVLPLPGLASAAPWDAAACGALDGEIDRVFPPSTGRVWTPDALRRDHASLLEAIRESGWPKLDDLRGKVVFVMEGVAVRAYLAADARLAGRRCFVYGEPGSAGTAFLLMNDAVRQREAIRARVAEGYLVRTRADSGTREARSGDTARREAAFASGAHIVSTDYPVPDARAGKETGWTDYAVTLPGGGVARLNPVTAAGRSGAVSED
jgi:hypothetical protein